MSEPQAILTLLVSFAALCAAIYIRRLGMKALRLADATLKESQNYYQAAKSKLDDARWTHEAVMDAVEKLAAQGIQVQFGGVLHYASSTQLTTQTTTQLGRLH